jgi:lysine-specific demethylase/histidyl-hydroxylase NO66
MGREEFAKSVFEKEPLHIKRNDPSFYEEVFTTDEIRDLFLQKENLIVKTDLNICRVVDGRRVDYNDGEETVLTPEQVWKAHDEEKFTLQVFQPQQRSLQLAELMSQLEDEFGCLCGANSYLTPQGTRGLAPHYDDVEVFALQISGSKRWKLYRPTIELPMSYSKDFEPEEVPHLEFYKEVVLEQGDLLYFPRGWIHHASTDNGEDSHHVTLSTYQSHSVKQLLKAAFDRALDTLAEKDVNDLPFFFCFFLLIPPFSFSRCACAKDYRFKWVRIHLLLMLFLLFLNI